MATSRISELSTSIASYTQQMDVLLSSMNRVSPSFSTEMPLDLFDDPKISTLRQKILLATDELQALVRGPVDLVTQHAQWGLVAIHALYRYNIPALVPLNGSISYLDLSKACELDEPNLKRFVRYAITQFIFLETTDGRVAHTGASKLLALSPAVNSWIGVVVEELWPSAPKAIDAMQVWPGTEEPNQAGYNLARNSSSTCFADMAADPVRSQRFAETMILWTQDPGYDLCYLFDYYSWGSLTTSSVVVDIGGSQGNVLINLAQRFPEIGRLVVQDKKEIITTGLKNFKASQPGEKSCLNTTVKIDQRLDFMAYDFFDEQPVKGAAVYLFRWIFHDYSDAVCVRILRALIPALREGSRICVNDHIIPPLHTAEILHQRVMSASVFPVRIKPANQQRNFDLGMKLFSNGKEREIEDWLHLFHETDDRFQHIETIQPPKSKMGIIVFEWQG